MEYSRSTNYENSEHPDDDAMCIADVKLTMKLTFRTTKKKPAKDVFGRYWSILDIKEHIRKTHFANDIFVQLT
jgi:hypothetical protein